MPPSVQQQSGLRIRLEGDFERLEHLVARLRTATAAVKAGSCDEALAAAEADASSETRGAEQHLANLGGDDTLERSLRMARSELRKALQRRLRQLGLFPERDDLLSLARTLHAERVVLQRTYQSKWLTWVWALVLALLVFGLFAWFEGGRARFPSFFILLVLWKVFGTPVKVLVTQRRLRLGEESFLLEAVERIRVEAPVLGRSHWRIVIRSRSGHEVTKQVFAPLADVVEALRTVGFTEDISSAEGSIVLVRSTAGGPRSGAEPRRL